MRCTLVFPLFPVIAEFDLAAHAALITRQPLLMLLEAIERLSMTAVAQRGKASHAHVDADGATGLGYRLSDRAFGLNAHEPPAS